MEWRHKTKLREVLLARKAQDAKARYILARMATLNA